jgi:peptidylprolyl isomerase
MISRIQFILIFCFLQLLQSRAVSEAGSGEDIRRKVLEAQDGRNGAALQTLLENDESARLACFAAGSVQDTVLLSRLQVLLGSADPSIRMAAAFALGQMNPVVTSLQRGKVTDALLGALEQERDEPARQRMVEALGKAGDASGLPRLLSAAAKVPGLTSNGETALSVGRFAYRNIRSPEATEFVVDQLRARNSPDVWKAGYAIMRIGVDSLLAPYQVEILRAIRDCDAETRMLLAAALGNMTDVDEAILRLGSGDADWRVRVNAIRSVHPAAERNVEKTIGMLMNAAGAANDHVSLTALSVLGRVKVPEEMQERVFGLLANILRDGSEGVSGGRKGEAANALAALFSDRAYKVLRETLEAGNLDTNSYVRSLGSLKTAEAFEDLRSFSASPSSRTGRIALEAIQNHLDRPNASGIRKILLDALSSQDMAVLTTAAGGLADSLLMDSSTARPLLAALGRLRTPDDVEPMVAIVQTLGSLKAADAVPYLVPLLADSDKTLAAESAASLEKITGDSYRQQIAPSFRPGYADYDWERIDWIARHPRVEVLTTKGRFLIELFPGEAPFTCLSFYRLTHRGFFDGLSFHRVVPNFVIQGGDPRGDGWGGPGYAIRSEFGYRSYERGMVGVASAGKDTEGCQFFVTHSRQPHLDGRYTIFGRVVEGMDVVDSIQAGDRIVRMVMVEER